MFCSSCFRFENSILDPRSSGFGQAKKNVLHHYLFGVKIIQTKCHRKCNFKDYPQKSQIYHWGHKFQATGSLNNLKKKAENLRFGRNLTARNPDNVDAVRDSIRRSPKKFHRRRSQELGLSSISLQRILKKDLQLYLSVFLKDKMFENNSHSTAQLKVAIYQKIRYIPKKSASGWLTTSLGEFSCVTSSMTIIRNTSNKNASFEVETSNQCLFNCYYISYRDIQSFFFWGGVVCLTNKWLSYEWVASILRLLVLLLTFSFFINSAFERFSILLLDFSHHISSRFLSLASIHFSLSNIFLFVALILCEKKYERND